MAKDYAARTSANRIYFGVRRTKKLSSMLHFVQDFYRVSLTPSIVGMTKTDFQQALSVASTRSEVRDNLRSQSATSAKEATPGPLVNERKWKEWETKFDNYLSTLIGSNGVPLSYVIRTNDDPPADISDLSNWTSRTIACAPLSGTHYEADRYTVYQQILSFTTGQPSEDWIKSTRRYSDGRRSMAALRAHFTGEGNASRNIAEAERIRENLHYKHERSMPFETFLTQTQKMFNIFEKEGEPMEDEAKLRFLFKKTKCDRLQKTVEALKVQQRTNPELVSFTTAANHLATAVSELPEYILARRNVSGVTSQATIYNSDGSIKTGEIDGWVNITHGDRQKVWAERRRLCIKYTPKSKNLKYIRKGGKGDTDPNTANRIKQLQDQNKVYKRKIKALKKSESGTGDGDNDGDSNDDLDAGDQFGGKAKKKKG